MMGLACLRNDGGLLRFHLCCGVSHVQMGEANVHSLMISLADAEAGLGISVKGKTTLVDGTSQDLGLFVKAIIDDGAAAKVVNYYSTRNMSTQ